MPNPENNNQKNNNQAMTNKLFLWNWSNVEKDEQSSKKRQKTMNSKGF